MKALLALFIALFALTAAVPATAGHGRCAMAGQTMAGMDMQTGKAGSSDPCCDHAGKNCALACDTICAATVAVPAVIAGPDFVANTPLVPVATPQQTPPSHDLATIDPPPKLHA